MEVMVSLNFHSVMWDCVLVCKSSNVTPNWTYEDFLKWRWKKQDTQM
jgi:hypothetical protein